MGISVPTGEGEGRRDVWVAAHGAKKEPRAGAPVIAQLIRDRYRLYFTEQPYAFVSSGATVSPAVIWATALTT